MDDGYWGGPVPLVAEALTAEQSVDCARARVQNAGPACAGVALHRRLCGAPAGGAYLLRQGIFDLHEVGAQPAAKSDRTSRSASPHQGRNWWGFSFAQHCL